MIRHGTPIKAEAGGTLIEGRLLGDHVDLAGPVSVLIPSGEMIVVDGDRLPITIAESPVAQVKRENPAPPAALEPTPVCHPPMRQLRHRSSRWKRPWYLRGQD